MHPNQYSAMYSSTPHSGMHFHGAPSRPSRGKLSDNIMTDSKGGFRNPDITLLIRQEPKEALVLSSGKEKGRKPVDPPPIVQLQVKGEVEAGQHFLQSPYLFMVADLWKADRDERCGDHGASNLYGGLCSSLHRLKDVDNKDGAFFIFGDISVKVTGTFRLHFSLYDLQTTEQAAVFLGSIATKPFKVMPPKDFQGLEESTYLSRAFSDQGVRLRLRKEPRAFAGQKRSYFADGMPPSQPSAPGRSSSSFYEDEAPPTKRYRADTEDRKESFVEHTPVAQPSFSSSYTPTQHSSFPTSSFTPAFSQASYAPTYSSLPQTTYAGSYAGATPSNYPAPYLSSSPYNQIRPSAEPRPYSIAPYSSQLNFGNLPQTITQSIPQSSIPHYPEIRGEEPWDPYTGLPSQPTSGP